MVSYTGRRTQAEGVGEQGAEDDIWE